MKTNWLIRAVEICAVSCVMVASAAAQEPKQERTVGAFLEFMSARTASDCERNRAAWERQRAAATPGEHVLFEANEEICQCMKESLGRVLQELPAETRSRRISNPNEAMPVALPAMQKCSSLALRSLFGGRLCPAYTQTMTREKLAFDEYCGCVKADIDTYSDARATEVGNALMGYLQTLGQASREGKPHPPRPAVIEPLHQVSLRCAQTAPGH
jgi:hypothetical protein